MDDSLMLHVEKTFNVNDWIITKLVAFMLAADGTREKDVDWCLVFYWMKYNWADMKVRRIGYRLG